jgi:exonuclease VII small subunit
MGASDDEHAGAGESPVEEMSYTEASAELDRIVGFFEGREVDVDQLVGRLVRATAIIEELDKRLRLTRMQVEQLVPRLTAVLEEKADELEPSGPGDAGDEHEPAVAVLTAEEEPSDARRSSRIPGGVGGGDDDSAPGLF